MRHAMITAVPISLFVHSQPQELRVLIEPATDSFPL